MTPAELSQTAQQIMEHARQNNLAAVIETLAEVEHNGWMRASQEIETIIKPVKTP